MWESIGVSTPVVLLMVFSETTPLRCQAASHCLSLLSLSVVGLAEHQAAYRCD